MGDRANVAILDYEGDAVVLYTHWGGYTLPYALRDALHKEWRWNDDAYLARIVFDEMTNTQHGEETGFGITANKLVDNEYPVLVVDCVTQRVARRSEADWLKAGRVVDPEGVTIAEYAAFDNDGAQRFRDA